jgi:hypothetical protein
LRLFACDAREVFVDGARRVGRRIQLAHGEQRPPRILARAHLVVGDAEVESCAGERWSDRGRAFEGDARTPRLPCPEQRGAERGVVLGLAGASLLERCEHGDGSIRPPGIEERGGLRKGVGTRLVNGRRHRQAGEQCARATRARRPVI